MRVILVCLLSLTFLSLLGCSDSYRLSLKPEEIQNALKDNTNGGFLYGTYNYDHKSTYLEGDISLHVAAVGRTSGVNVILNKERGYFLIYLAPGQYRFNYLDYMSDGSYVRYASQNSDNNFTINPGQVVYCGNLVPNIYHDITTIYWGFNSVSNRQDDDQKALLTVFPDLSSWQFTEAVPATLVKMAKFAYQPASPSYPKMP